jgi:hypothetical protein
MPEYRPRILFEITEEQQALADKYLNTHGIRRAVMSALLQELLDMIDEHGYMVVGILLDKNVRVRDIVPSLSKAERMVKDG